MNLIPAIVIFVMLASQILSSQTSQAFLEFQLVRELEPTGNEDRLQVTCFEKLAVGISAVCYVSRTTEGRLIARGQMSPERLRPLMNPVMELSSPESGPKSPLRWEITARGIRRFGSLGATDLGRGPRRQVAPSLRAVLSLEEALYQVLRAL